MSQWPVAPLAHALRHRKEFITIDDSKSYRRCRVQLHAKGVVARDSVSGAEIKTKRQQVCRAGEFLVAEIDAKMGGFGLVPSDLEDAVVSSHYFLFEIDDAILDKFYLDYYCRTEQFRKQVEAQGSTNYAAIRPSDVLTYTIPLPEISEQHSIVNYLDALTKKSKQVIAHLDAMEIDANALVMSIHHKLAAGRIVRLGDILELDEDSTLIQPNQDYPQVGVRGFGGGLFAKAAVTGSETTYRAFNRLYTDAIVLSQVKGWEGAIALCPSELSGMYVSPEYRTFRCTSGRAFAPYLENLIKTSWFWSLMQNATRGVGARRERTRPEQFLNINLPMPTYDEQVTASAIFSQLTVMKARHAAIREANAALVPAMLERIFNSERRSKLQQ